MNFKIEIVPDQFSENVLEFGAEIGLQAIAEIQDMFPEMKQIAVQDWVAGKPWSKKYLVFEFTYDEVLSSKQLCDIFQTKHKVTYVVIDSELLEFLSWHIDPEKGITKVLNKDLVIDHLHKNGILK